MKYPEINAIYDHYKGGRYKVITLAKHTETDEILVIYKSIHFGTIYARPLEQWFNTIEQTNQQRFTKVNKKDQ
jgi:cyclomaltodextrinase